MPPPPPALNSHSTSWQCHLLLADVFPVLGSVTTDAGPVLALRPPKKLEGSKFKGQLLIFGATNWDLIGRKEVPKQQAAYRNLGQNLWGPHRYGCLTGIQVRTVVSGPCAAHSLLITTEGKLWSWGRNDKGQLGHGDTKRVDAPKPVEVLSSETVVLAACGRNHTLVLTESGSIFAFGENKMGQLGLGNQTDAVPSPTQNASSPPPPTPPPTSPLLGNPCDRRATELRHSTGASPAPASTGLAPAEHRH
ncbi:protein RCC2-like [Tiliqua scincoides]|uniref:protein RCC2-like n=1 Tax=Tiliqua scincoides TaxID=71010 RepID=UPI003463269A